MKGLYKKYIVTKTSGKPIDPNAEFIVLRIDDGQYLQACRAGASAFAEAVREQNPLLADDIQSKLNELQDPDDRLLDTALNNLVEVGMIAVGDIPKTLTDYCRTIWKVFSLGKEYEKQNSGEPK